MCFEFSKLSLPNLSSFISAQGKVAEPRRGPPLPALLLNSPFPNGSVFILLPRYVLDENKGGGAGGACSSMEPLEVGTIGEKRGTDRDTRI